MPDLRIVDVQDEAGFLSLPPCADPRFDHRTCDYWEDADRGAAASRPAWLQTRLAASEQSRPRPVVDNPFASSRDTAAELAAALRAEEPIQQTMLMSASDVLAGDDLFATPAWNPFAPGPPPERARSAGVPRKLGLLDRGRGIFGSYARVAYLVDEPVAFAQFGPLSAYPRARHIRELYPALPVAPPPGVITCIATTSSARGHGYARALVLDVCDELGRRGFAAVEAYPDLTRPVNETSAARPDFWLGCGFSLAASDDRYPVMRRELD
ncbi:MAG: GNAT family N-acetyltransferase [Chloroflexi bacterium]|nr:GNAT family N-acetyltransferase [Chloroflexota bacterium]